MTYEEHFMVALNEAYPNLYEKLMDLILLKNYKQIKLFLMKHKQEINAVKFSMLMYVFLKGEKK